MGINYNGTKVSQKSSDAQYPYYNGTQIAQVYYNGNLVWKKYTVLPYTFSGGTITKYTGSESSVTIPSQYYTITDIDGTVIYTSTAVGTATSVTAIGDDAFANNTTITSVTIPSSITSIGARAFQKCYNLSTVSMSATPTSIGYCAFALTNITKLSSYMYNCTSIGQGAFATQKGWYLKSPSNVTSLDGDAVLNRLLATNMGSNLSADGYTGAGPVYIIRSRFNVHSGGGSDTPSGGAFSCTSTLSYSGGSFTSLSCSVAYGGSSYGYTYCIASTSTPTVSSSASMTSTPSNYSSWTGLKTSNFSPVAGETDDHDMYAQVVGTCLAEGTLITLTNGTQKPVEQITYKDLLLVWNFETGSYDYQYPLAIIKGNNHTTKYRINLEDHTYLEICGRHDIYDPVAHTFRVYGEGAINEVDQDYYVLKHLTNKAYACYKITSIEILSEETTAYSIITGGTITAFANDIMVGYGTLNFSRIKNSNSFEKEFQEDKTLCYTYDRFKEEMYSDSSKYLILGLNLHYVDYYNKDPKGLPAILAPFNCMIPLKKQNNKYVCTIGLLDGNTLIEAEHLEDEEIILPEINSELKTHWYVIGEYKLLKPGDTYKINFSTLIRAV